MADLIMRDINKIYKGGFHAVHDFNLEVKDGEFIVLVGPSGCGKSTMLRMIAGLETISSGELLMDGKVVNNMAPSDRDIAMVFQNYALYSNMTVYENMGFSLTIRHEHSDKIHEEVMKAADIVELFEVLNRKPKALSGGQRQRVALGRSIVRHSSVFLMDEPLSNLDAKLRDQTRKELIKVHDKLKSTFIYVTHDQTEAMAMADRIIVMNDGVIQQVGTPLEIFNHPANVFVGGFMGSPAMNFVNAIVKNGKCFIGDYEFDVPNQEVIDNYEGKDIIIGVRPTHFYNKIKGETTDPCFDLTVDFAELLGPEYNIYTSLNGVALNIKVDAQHEIKNGQVLELGLDISRIHFFDSETHERI
jgi:multiple sugar transport system ATP-binding protein